MTVYSAFLRRASACLMAVILAVLPAFSVAENTSDEITVAPMSEAGAPSDAAPEPDALGGESAEPSDEKAADEAAEPSAEDEATAEGEAPADKAQDGDAVNHIATANVALKVRKSPDKSAGGVGSIKRGETVYILELGADWSKVRTRYADGFVMTKYLDGLREYDPVSEEAGKAVEAPDFDMAALQDKDGFKNSFFAYTVESTGIYEEPSEDSRRLDYIKVYEQVVVSENSGGWSYCRHGSVYGFIPTDSLFKWDRINAFAGDIPGLVRYPLMISVKRTTNVYSMKDNSVLKTVNPGALLCAEKPDSLGRYKVPYYREDGYVNSEDVAGAIEVTPWEDAQPGDLISVMTTYYAVGVSTLNYQGRNWNIYLATELITGTVLEPGDSFDMNKCIGPYSKSTGYKSAPIMSPTKLTGYGGGTCQVNTTFYITTMALPLLVTHRRVHANVGIYYCKKGFDAAVGSGDINLQMTNTMPYAVRYQFFVSDGAMTCCIYRDH